MQKYRVETKNGNFLGIIEGKRQFKKVKEYLHKYNKFVCCLRLGKRLLKHHAVKTSIKNVADYFKKFGFMVTMDFDGIN